MRTVRATELLFGAIPCSLGGRGARVLLVDACPLSDETEQQAAARRRALLTDGDDGTLKPGGPLGIAPLVHAACLSDEAVRAGELTSLERYVAEQAQPFDVVVFCRPFTVALGPRQLAILARLSESSLLLAPPDRSHPERALGPHVLAVKSSDSEASGSNAAIALGASALVLARAPDGSVGHLRAAEAAAPLVAGLAGLWCERLRGLGLPVDGPTLRALLLSAAARARVTGHPLGSCLLEEEAPFICRLAEDRATVAVHTGSTPVLTVVHPGAPAADLWFAPSTQVIVRMESSAPDAFAGDSWTSLLLTESAEALELELATDRPVTSAMFTCVGFGLRAAAAPKAQPSPRMARRPLTIVGIAASHDASACVMRDGRVVSAVQLERLSRKKHDGRAFLHSREAVDYCLASAGLRERDVDFFAFNCMPLAPGVTGMGLPSHDETFELFDPFGERAVFVSHHLCHAFGAFLGASFDEATVIVCDGYGGTTVGSPDLVLRGPELLDYLGSTDKTSDGLHVFSAYRFGKRGWSLVDREYGGSFSPLSGHGHLGEMYAAVSQYVFGDWQESGKLMGLAPYGDPDRFGPSLLRRDEHGRLHFTPHWKNQLRRVLSRGEPLEYRDLAARVQRDLEDALVDRVRTSISRAGETRVAYAGGVALNSVANDRLRRETGASALYVMPASHDAGTSIGAAAAAHQRVTGSLEPNHLTTDAFGHAYGVRDYEAALAAFSNLVKTSAVSLRDLAERLEKKQVIGWFEGGSEFGPRALGQRSLLASPIERDMWTYINRRIKYREDFRPFAPMVPEELAAVYFEIDEPAPFMLRVVKVRERYRAQLGAITHVDGSARVQTVSRAALPMIHELLLRFGERAGIPVLVNTSLNVRGEPLVETPTQALEMLLATHLDALVFAGQLLVEPLGSGRTLSPDSILTLPPKCHIEVHRERSVRRQCLVAEARGNQSIELPEWALPALSRLDEPHTVAELVASLTDARHGDDLRSLLDSLFALRLVAEARAKRPDEAEVPDVAVTAPLPEASVPLLEDATELLAGTQRVASVADTIARVRNKLTELGVTRVADLTDYDHYGVPVVSCIRPFVHDDDITCTQGKGLCLEDAVASALMETVERFSAWRREHVPTRIATVSELRRADEPFLALSAIGGDAASDAALEWVWAEGLVGSARWVPAATVFAPYHPPPAVTCPFTWCTTGLSAGNSLAEALAHGIGEVIERDALSRYIDGHPARLLELSSVPAGPERDLLERIASRGAELFVVDLSSLSTLPTFSVALFDRDGPEPRLPVSGQGCSRTPRGALRRAILEALQSRVVAIQGSREDLTRHASHWIEDESQRLAHWHASKAAAGRGGVSCLASEPPPVARVGELLLDLTGRLVRAGYGEVLFVDLTHPRLAIPVVSVIIPGMYDGEGDPKRRKRPPSQRGDAR